MTDIFSTKGVVDSFIEQRGFIPIVFLHRIDAENEWNMYSMIERFSSSSTNVVSLRASLLKINRRHEEPCNL